VATTTLLQPRKAIITTREIFAKFDVNACNLRISQLLNLTFSTTCNNNMADARICEVGASPETRDVSASCDIPYGQSIFD
jgi:hypothetical protein